MIRINDLTKSFGKFRALDNISVDLQNGRVISLLGPNGSGKTTLLKSILGLVHPERGTVYINDTNIRSSPSYRRMIGYMPQIGRYPENMTIAQVMKMVKELRSDTGSYDDELIGSFGLREIEKKSMRTLSGGTRQKVSAALAFMFMPEILILDEPTAGLDPLSNEILKDKIAREKANGKLILITSHVLSDLEDMTSHVIYLHEGKMVFYKTLEELRDYTGELKLNKMIATVMKQSGMK
jgi:Cu-processing system ATP-binding protein